MKVKCIVAGINANGSPDLFPIQVECTLDQYNDGFHYDISRDIASDEGYEPKLVIDERDDGFELINVQEIDWSTVQEV